MGLVGTTALAQSQSGVTSDIQSAQTDDIDRTEVAETLPASASLQIINTHWRCEHYSYEQEAVQLTMQSSPYSSVPEYNQPIFAIQFPETSTATAIFFVLREEKTREHLYEAWLTNIDASQPVNISPWSDGVPSLEVGQHYQWLLAVPCRERIRPDMPYNSGCLTQTNEGTILHTALGGRRGAAGSSGDHFVCPGASPDD